MCNAENILFFTKNIAFWYSLSYKASMLANIVCFLMNFWLFFFINEYFLGDGLSDVSD